MLFKTFQIDRTFELKWMNERLISFRLKTTLYSSRNQAILWWIGCIQSIAPWHTDIYTCNSRPNLHLTTLQRIHVWYGRHEEKYRLPGVKYFLPKEKIERETRNRKKEREKIKMSKVAIKIKRLPFRTLRSTFAYLMIPIVDSSDLTSNQNTQRTDVVLAINLFFFVRHNSSTYIYTHCVAHAPKHTHTHMVNAAIKNVIFLPYSRLIVMAQSEAHKTKLRCSFQESTVGKSPIKWTCVKCLWLVQPIGI